jgi:hypothetical protein
MGLLAATRDIVSFLRHEKADAEGTPNSLAARSIVAIALVPAERPIFADFLYLPQRRRGGPLLRGVMPHIAAERKHSPTIVSANLVARPTSTLIQSIPARNFRSPTQ